MLLYSSWSSSDGVGFHDSQTAVQLLSMVLQENKTSLEHRHKPLLCCCTAPGAALIEVGFHDSQTAVQLLSMVLPQSRKPLGETQRTVSYLMIASPKLRLQAGILMIMHTCCCCIVHTLWPELLLVKKRPIMTPNGMESESSLLFCPNEFDSGRKG